MPSQQIFVVDQLPSGATGESLWQDGILQKYHVQCRYVRFGGMLALPIASDLEEDEDCVVVKTASGRWEKHVLFEVERIGTPAILPDFVTDDHNEILMHHEFSLATPILWDGRLFKHAANGFYRYALKKAPTKSEGFKTAACVYYGTQAKARYRDGHFQRRVLKW